MAGLRIEGLRTRVLGPLDLTLTAGELVLVSGPSGSGKSLLLRAIADLDPHEGEVWLNDEARSGMAPWRWRQRVGLLPAESSWWAETVGEHLPGVQTAGARRFTRTPRATPAPSAAPPSMLHDWLARLGFAPDVLDWSIERLSTGERQRLALVRLLVRLPEVLLLDEASANLDPANTAQVESILAHYRQTRRAPVLWISHDPAQHERLGGRALVIRQRALEPA
ncbi:MAG: ATP-binding cassette domain-containing protein [Sphingobacteriia bacterium]|nr:ATP-binding cassette domain-containing protein [Sphingobacteriia bacterium]NCC39587.1 ATP-binding cassette domain-containing protein [Gammaproteobacteria bacterium]